MKISFTQPQKTLLHRLIQRDELSAAKMVLIEIIAKKPKIETGLKNILLRIHKNIKFITLITNTYDYATPAMVTFQKDCDYILASALLHHTKWLDKLLKELDINPYKSSK